MAIEVNEQMGSPTSAGYTADGHRTYTRLFNAISDSTAANAASDVLLANDTPKPGDIYTGVDTAAYVTSVGAERDENVSNKWTVTAQYQTRDVQLPADVLANPGVGNPLATLGINESAIQTQESWSAGFYPQVMEQDAANTPLLNTVGRPPDPPIETDSHYQVIRLEKNALTFDTGLFADYINTVNSDQFLGFQAGTVKCANITASNRYIGKYQYVNAQFEFHVRDITITDQAWDPPTQAFQVAKGWDMVLLNQGFYKITNPNRGAGVDAIVARIINSDVGNDADDARMNDPVDEPALLTEKGEVITAQQLLDNISGNGGVAPVYVRFQQYELLPFAALDLE